MEAREPFRTDWQEVPFALTLKSEQSETVAPKASSETSEWETKWRRELQRLASLEDSAEA